VLQDINFISHCSPSLSTSAPPLTVDSVLKAVQGVDWRRLGKVLLRYQWWSGSYPKINEIEMQHQCDDDRLHAVVKTWLQGDGRHGEPSWRYLIWMLDRSKITKVADNIRHFAEPVLGKWYDPISVSTFFYSAYTVEQSTIKHPWLGMLKYSWTGGWALDTYSDTLDM